MGPNDCYLITILCGDGLVKVALKSSEPVEFFMEDKRKLREQLPPYIQSMGPIVHVEEITEITISK